MGMPFGKPEYCHQNHPHRTVEDAMECDRFYSNRLKEDDHIHRMENMMSRGQNTRFNPYPPNRQANMEGQHPNEASPFRDRTNDGVHHPRYQTRSEAETKGREDRNYQTGNEHTDVPKKEKKKDSEESKRDREESRPGFLAGFFSSGNYYACALHHKHRTLEDAQECVRKLEERNKEAHQKRMGEKYNRGERDGLRLEAEETRKGPIIEEID